MAGESKNYPKKYWWVVLVALPVVLALIGTFPQLIGRGGEKSAGGSGMSIVGNNNTVTIDNSTQMTVINNISVIAQEYQKYTGQALSDDLKQLIERAVAAATKNDHAASVRLYEQVANQVPVPAIFNNLAVEYAKTQNVAASQRALTQAIQKDPTNEVARKNLALIAPAARTSVAFASGAGVRTESSAAPAIQVEAFDAGFAKVEGIHVVDAGAGSGGGSYSIRYQPEPGTPVLVEPKTYDVLVKTSGGGVFLLAANVNVKEGTLARINPNALVGAIEVRPLTRKGFPELKEIVFVDRATGSSRLIRQSTATLGVTLPIAPGAYDVLAKTDDGQADLVRNLEIKARERKRIDTDDEVAAIVVQEPSIRGLNVKAIYALRTGTNEIAGKSIAFGKPMLVYAGEAYDIALEQPAGLTRIKSKLTPSRGSLTEVR
jgi:ribosomal protein L17